MVGHCKTLGVLLLSKAIDLRSRKFTICLNVHFSRSESAVFVKGSSGVLTDVTHLLNSLIFSHEQCPFAKHMEQKRILIDHVDIVHHFQFRKKESHASIVGADGVHHFADNKEKSK